MGIIYFAENKNGSKKRFTSSIDSSGLINSPTCITHEQIEVERCS